MNNFNSFPTFSKQILVLELNASHQEMISGHLLKLSIEDRLLRFGMYASDNFINNYVDSLNFSRDAFFGVFDQSLNIIGLAHLAYPDHNFPSITAEFGVSVSERGRDMGIGTALFKRAAMHCRNTDIEILYVHCLSSNEAMMHIAEKAGMRVENVGGETDAYLRLSPGDKNSILSEALQDQVATVDYSLKQSFHRAVKLASSLYKLPRLN